MAGNAEIVEALGAAMKQLGSGVALAATILLSGCVSPLTQPSAPMFQRRVSHAQDVKHLAGDVANKLAQRVLAAGKPTVFVAPGPADMPFAAEFKGYLEQSLMEKGFPISQTARGAEVVNFEVQPFLYGDDHQKYPVDYVSVWGIAAKIGRQVDKSVNHDDYTWYTPGLVVGPALDLLHSMSQATPAEVVLKVSIVDADRVFYTDARSFYVTPADLPFYMTAIAGAAPQPMSADPGGPPVVTLRLSGGSE